MIHALAEVEESISSAVEGKYNIKKEVNTMVEFDAIKQSLSNYGQPLLEMGDSL